MRRRTWERLQERAAQWIDSLDAFQAFQKEKQQQGELEPFDCPSALIDYLHTKNGELKQKNQIYAALVRITQRQGEGAKLAFHLLWLGLWPALDATYGRLLRLYYYQDQEALVSEIGPRFVEEIHKANLGRINRVAATLTRNVQRDILTGLKRQWADEGRRAALPSDDSERFPARMITPGESRLGFPYRLDTQQDIHALRALLITLMGAETDAELARGTAVLGETQREVAERLGMTHAAANKRIQKIGKL